MLNYVTQIDRCRSILLREYFGEKDVADCGKCDICRKNKTKKSETKQTSLENKIIELVLRGITEVKEIPRHIAGEKTEIATVLRSMIENKILKIDEKGTLLINN